MIEVAFGTVILLGILAHWLLADRWRRRHDLQVLWPTFKRKAYSLEQARRGFIMHMSGDPAWRHLEKLNDEEFGDWVRKHLV